MEVTAKIMHPLKQKHVHTLNPINELFHSSTETLKIEQDRMMHKNCENRYWKTPQVDFDQACKEKN